MPPNRPPLVALLAVIALAACRGERLPELETVEPPSALGSMTRPVQRQFEAAFAEVAPLRDDPQAPRAELAEAYGRLGMLFHAYGELAPARAAYRNAIRLDADQFRWHYLLAVGERLGGDWAVSERALGRALALRPTDAAARALRAELLLDRGRLEEAEAALRDLLDEADGEAEAAVGLAKIALARRSPAEALTLLRRALARQPESTEVQYLLGQAHAALGERELAARYLDSLPPVNLLRQRVGVGDPLLREVQALAVGSRAHSRAGALAAARENYRLALVEFDQALAADPDLLPPRFGKALAYVQLGERETAIAELRALLARQPDHADSLELLGSVLAASGETAEAESTLRRALELDPLAERGRVELAQLQRSTGRLEEALDHYRRALETAPAMGEAHFGQVVTLLALGRYDQARAALARARRALPGDRTLAVLAARWQAAAPLPETRDAAEALKAARALAAHGLELPLAETFAMAHAAAGDFALAARWQEAALATATESETAPWLAARLALYRDRRPCPAPWRPDEVWLRSAAVAPEAPI